MRQVKIWPHVTLVALLCAVVGGTAAALLVRHHQNNQNNEAQTLGSAARIERIDGEVGVDHNARAGSDAQFVQATTNTPVSAGDRIYARDNARASVAFTGRNFARLNPRTALDVMYLTDDRTQLALRDGSALFDVGELPQGGLFEVATPQCAYDFDQPGLYEVGIDDNGSTYVSVLNGVARAIGVAGTGEVSKGEMLTIAGQAAADIALSRLDRQYAGNLLNDYYGYRYPQTYDGRYANYDAYLNDPSYYDPQKRYVSYRYVSDYIPGVEDLDAYGDWQDVSGYGECWHPRVDAGWAPYQQGYWDVSDPDGLTWVSSEPWGYAPYHYGRWANVNNGWYWIPERVNTRPAYAPALVAFVPLTQANEVGWVPLGPGDPYVRTYYDQNWQPHYVGGTPVVERQIVNINVPGAVTVVPVQNFNGVVTQRDIVRVDPHAFAQTRPVFDPFTADALRREAMQNASARRRIEVPQDVARRIENTRVFASSAPSAAPFRPNLAQAMRVEAVPENQRRARMQFRDERQAATAEQRNAAGPQQPASQAQGQLSAADQQRNQRMAALAAQAARGDSSARRQLRQLERQNAAQQQQPSMPPQAGAPQAANERAQRMAAQQQRAQGEQVGLRQQQQAQREAERQQALGAQQQQQQQRAAMRQQADAQRQAARQAAMQQRQQADAQRAQQVRAHAQTQQAARQQVRQAPQPQQRVRQQPQALGPPQQARRQGPPPQQQAHQQAPQHQARQQGPPPQAANPQSQGHGKGKDHH
ncbi:MAG TPA: DUF6600 domain-containing protein [Pyrinomonadaceae bacterium]|nr:DUF6600 domain-containing protein [Pyrinomonadaceae bacterium]